jgi:hypothetical protein
MFRTRVIGTGLRPLNTVESSSSSSSKAEMTNPEGIPHSKVIPLSECEIVDGKLLFQGRIYVPGAELRLYLIQLAHDSCESGHPGKNKLYALLSRYYWWPSMSKDTSAYALRCHGCHRNKVNKLRYRGTLKPLPLPLARWRDISVDLVGPLPWAKGPSTPTDRHRRERRTTLGYRSHCEIVSHGD